MKVLLPTQTTTLREIRELPDATAIHLSGSCDPAALGRQRREEASKTFSREHHLLIPWTLLSAAVFRVPQLRAEVCSLSLMA